MEKELSERLDPDAMIPWLRRWFKSTNNRDVLVGAGLDDCGVFRIGNQALVVTTDYFNSRPAMFEYAAGDHGDLGRLLVATNVSDLLSTGARPVALLIGAMFPRDTATTDFIEFNRGVRREATKCGMVVLGGDTKLGSALSVCATAIGLAESKTSLILKTRARVSHSIWLSGPIGTFASAVAYLAKGGADAKLRAWAARTIRTPRLPLARAAKLRRLGIAKAGTDISDGLGADLASLAEASGVAVVIDCEAIPVERNVRHIASFLGVPAWAFAFASGGDFQFLVTVPRRHETAIAALGFVRIGDIVDAGQGNTVAVDGRRTALPELGHRDARNLSFGEEIQSLLQGVVGGTA
jgi:thiamine-monophosphate kinase